MESKPSSDLPSAITTPKPVQIRLDLLEKTLVVPRDPEEYQAYIESTKGPETRLLRRDRPEDKRSSEVRAIFVTLASELTNILLSDPGTDIGRTIAVLDGIISLCHQAQSCEMTGRREHVNARVVEVSSLGFVEEPTETKRWDGLEKIRQSFLRFARSMASPYSRAEGSALNRPQFQIAMCESIPGTKMLTRLTVTLLHQAQSAYLIGKL